MSTRVYVGNLPYDIRTREVEDLFYKYGRIVDINIKVPNQPPAYAFVEFEDPRDAEDAVRGRDGYRFDGNTLRVEPSKPRGGDRGSDRRGGRFDDDRRPRQDNRRGEFRVYVSGLPTRASWQDLKDHMRQAGDVRFVNVDKQGGGEVDYSSKEDMDNALRSLDRSEFRGRDDQGIIRVSSQPGGAGDRSQSRSPPRSDHRSRSRSRSHSRSRSYSKSPAHHESDRQESPVRKTEGDDNANTMQVEETSEQQQEPSQDEQTKPAEAEEPAAKKVEESEVAEDVPEADTEKGAEANEDAESGEKQDYAAMKVVDLRSELKSRGLNEKGKKAELVARLTEADA